MSIRENNLLKISNHYSEKILPKIDKIRGATRIALILNSLGIKQISSKEENHYTVKITREESRNFSDIKDIEKYARYEYTQSLFIIENLDKDSVFYDIGAYHGYHTLLGTLGKRVYSFEPDPENLETLKKNIELNSEQEIELIEKPIWSEETEIELNIGKGGKSNIAKDSGRLKTETVTLDSFVEKEENTPPDMIKIDIEGAEYQALKGAKRTIEKYRPIIILEAHIGERLQELGGSLEQIDSLLKERNYNIKKNQRNGEIHIYAKPE